jgi:hypothetical protein
MQTTTSEHYKPTVRFGLGGVPLGNEFAVPVISIVPASILLRPALRSKAPRAAAGIPWSRDLARPGK